MNIRRVLPGMLLAALCYGQARDAEFARLADRYFDEAVYRYDPVSGTAAGFHQYDSLLPDGSKAEVDAQIAILKKYLAEVQAFGGHGLSSTAAADRELVQSQIQGTLLELETIRPWEKNPDVYSSGASNAIFVIMSRNFAPPGERLKAAIARERLIPRTFQSARANLRNPPHIYTEIALEQLPGIVSFFQNDVPSAFKQVTDPALLAQFQTSNRAVIEALNSYQQFLKDKVLPGFQRGFPAGSGDLCAQTSV